MSLPSLYKSFRKVIIYGSKSTIKVNEVKEYLLNKDKFDTQLTGESHHDNSRQILYSSEKSNNVSSTGNSKHKNLTCNYCHKKVISDLSVGFKRRNNQMLMLLNWLEEMQNSATFYLLQTNQLVTKIDES